MTGPARVFIAGASGVIGRALGRLLIADGRRVVGTTRRESAAHELAASGIEPVVLDVFDAEAVRSAVVIAQPDAVVHLVTDLPSRLEPDHFAESLKRTARVREVGTRHLVDACRAAGVQTVAAQSIAFAYAPGPQPFFEDAPLDVQAADPMRALTARAIAELERLVLGGPFRGMILRFGKFYGPGTWSETAPTGGPVHVDAAADALRRALESGDLGIYNVAEPDGTVSVEKAVRGLGWNPSFRSVL